MKTKSLYIVSILWLFSTLSGWAQTPNFSSEDLVKGKIRIKLNKDQVQGFDASQALSIGKKSQGTGISSIDEASNEVGIRSIRRVFPFSVKNEAKHRKYGLHQWFELEFDETIDPNTVVARFRKISELEIVKPVYKKIDLSLNDSVKPLRVKVLSKGSATKKNDVSTNSDTTFFNDPLLPNQWHFENNGTIGTENMDIDLFTAWESTTGRSDIIVAIVDQGVDISHEDLEQNIWRNEAEINGIEGVDDDQNGYIDDFNGYNFRLPGALTVGDHGTHVAGTLGAVSNNNMGVAGVAGGNGTGNGVKMISCQVFDNRAAGGGNFAEAIVYGADQGAVISQNSWGYNLPNYYEPEVYDAIKYFIAEAGQYEGSPMKGGVLFFATGNSSNNLKYYPAAFEEVISVISLSPDGFPAPYTNYGDWTDIAAYGGDETNFNTEGGILSTLPYNTYGYMEGTSMACPHVSGVAALVLSKNEDKDFTADDLKRIMLNSTSRFIFDHQQNFGRGVLNAANALADDNRIPPAPVTDLSADNISYDQLNLKWTVPVDEDNGEPAYFYLTISEEPITTVNFDSGPVYSIDNSQTANSVFEISFNELIKNTAYWFAVKAVDRFGNISEISNLLKVTTTNLPHFLESTQQLEFTIDVSKQAVDTLTVNFSNIGDGIVQWETIVVNEEYFWSDSTEQANLQNELVEKAQSAALDPDSYKSSNPTFKPLNGDEAVASVFSAPKYWENDKTEFSAGLSYENGTDPFTVIGTGSQNAGLVFATRFNLPYGSTFNMTHLAVVLYPNIKDKPIYIELKKGSQQVENAETVYVQEYYPDTTNVLKYYHIPLYHPKRFFENEIMWVVLHFPQEMDYPLAVQAGEGESGYFLMSRNKGYSFEDAFNATLRPIIPMLSALSTGDDGSYVFLNPNTGDISKGETMSADVILDATALTNGNHLASVGIITNDINKPVVNIEVKVNVTGQLADIDTEELHQFNAYLDKTNELEFEIRNIGLGDLVIYGLSSTDTGIAKNFDQDIVIKPHYQSLIPFKYTSSKVGSVNASVLLNTSQGDIRLTAQINVIPQPTLEVVAANSTIHVDYGKTATLTVQLANTTASSVLEYDLSHYNIIDLNAGKQPITIDYDIVDSNDPNGPKDNQWEKIAQYPSDSIIEPNYSAFDLGMKFPFSDELFSKITTNIRGQLFFSTEGVMGVDENAEEYGVAKGLFVPLRIHEKALRVKKLWFQAQGDKAVFSFLADIMGISQGYRAIGEVSYQVVLFRNGAIEYRFQNVDAITSEMQTRSGIQGMRKEEMFLYSDYTDTDKLLYSGKVIRFNPTQITSSIVSASAKKGILNFGETKQVTFTIDPEFATHYAGLYHEAVLIKSNTTTPNLLLPFDVNVSGVASFSAQDTLNFEPNKVGQKATAYLTIENTGTAQGELISASFNNTDFSLQETLPYKLAANSKAFIPVAFNTNKASKPEAILTLNFSDGSQHRVIVTSESLPDPSFTLDLPTKIDVNLKAGETATIPFTIQADATGAALQYTFKNNLFASVQSSQIKNGVGMNSPNPIDEYGYWWTVSSNQKPFYKWEDIGTDIQILQIEQGLQQAIALPFKFPFFGAEYDSIWVSSNGYITVIEPTADDVAFDFTPEDGISGIITPFMSYLKAPTANSGVKFKREEKRIILEWDSFVALQESGSYGELTFQLEMHDDGRVFFHYKNISAWGGSLNYGFESPDESETVETPRSWILDWSIITDETTLAFVPPLKDKLATAQQQALTLQLSAENIYSPGTYQDTILLYTNSSAQPVTQIPVTLHVTGEPTLSVNSNLTWDDQVFHSALLLKQTFTLKNTGYSTLVLKGIAEESIPTSTLFDNQGSKIVRNTLGTLLSPIVIEPWKTTEITIQTPISTQENLSGALLFTGNFETKRTSLTANIVDSPQFSWNATNQQFSLNNTETANYEFVITNTGTTPLKYNLVPTVTSVQEVEFPVIVDKIGNYTKTQPIAVDSMYLGKKPQADGVFTPQIWEGNDLAFANKFVAPQNGFFITHIKTYNYLDNVGEFVNIVIYTGGDLPEEGQKVFEQKFVINEKVDNEWITFPLDQPILIPEGETFFITLRQPVTTKYMGLEYTSKPADYANSLTGSYKSEDHYFWWYNFSNTPYTWKIMPLTAASDGQWIELDQHTGSIPPGASQNINTKITAQKAGVGQHNGKVIIINNDINQSRAEFDLQLNVNGQPEFTYHPNSYKDTIMIVETENLLLNYLFQDPENENMIISAQTATNTATNTANTATVNLTQTSPTTAQVKINTDYNSSGHYAIPVLLTDEVGNITTDTLQFNVTDKNRAPVFNTKFSTIQLNLADPKQAYTIDPREVFSDPDNDQLEFLAGNYNPELIDMSISANYIDLHPLTTGTALVAVAADDGKDDGFVVYTIYVEIINDPNAIKSNVNNVGNSPQQADAPSELKAYPNRVNNEPTNLVFTAENESSLLIEVFSANGTKIVSQHENQIKAGQQKRELNLSTFGPGLYFGTVHLNNQKLGSFKVLVENKQ